MLTLQFVPYHEISSLSSEGKVRKLLSLVKSDKILLMEGRLDNQEETRLIEKTMEQITKSFKGIEICTIFPESKNLQLFDKVRRGLLSAMLGRREGITIIGPATIIKEIKRDPNKIELLTIDKRKRR